MKSERIFFKKVVIESPYKGDVKRNMAYLKICFLDSINRGEAPTASHKLYTDVLNDDDEEERKLGIQMGLVWLRAADLVAFYTDLGWSPGMVACLTEIKSARLRVPYEIRKVEGHVISAIRDAGC